VREEVEPLEHHADLRPVSREVPFPRRHGLAAAPPRAERLTVELDRAAVDRLQERQQPQERALARA